MKQIGPWLAAGVLLSLVTAACGSVEDAPTRETDGGKNTGGSGAESTGGAASGTGGETNGGAPSAGGVSASGGAPAFNCDQTPCQNVAFGGQSLPACCLSDTACGVSLIGICVDRSVVPTNLPEGGGFPLGTPEDIVLDPTCPSAHFDFGVAIDLEGCCDQTGVCGVSTAGFASMTGGTGFTFPSMCITSTDTGQFGPVTTADAGPPIPCNYPKSDAGAKEAG